MKELSIEEKIKAAKEKLKEADAIEYNLPDSAHAIRTTVYSLFPELKESDDESIRKRLLAWLKSTDGQTLPMDEYNAAIAWLEKQAQKPAWSEEDKAMINETLYFINEYQKSNRCKDENGMQNSVSCEHWLKSLKDRVQPKPAWSEEDEEEANYIADFIENLIKKEKLVSKKTMIMEEMVAWLRNIKYHYFPQPKQEWSEEDEKILTTIVDYIISYNVLGSKYIDFLKSLRPQSKWKPSDEQMDALYTYIYNPQYFSSPDPRMELVESVYKDLKKLMEE